MTKQTEALKLALEALEWFTAAEQGDEPPINKAITAIKEALAQPELVGWQYREANDDGTWGAWLGCDKRLAEDHWRQVRAIYTIPPQRPWVGLTDEEIEEAYAKPTLRKMYQAIEAKLKELNT